MSVIVKINTKTEQICRLCLKVAKNGFREIDDIMKQLFDIVLFKMDLDLTRDPMICQDCAELAKKCLIFKSIWIDREKNILSFSAARRISKESIKFIYAEREQVAIVNNEDFDICRFCMSRLKINNFVPLDTLLNESMFEMITKYMSEMDFNVPEDPIICTTCRENLEGYSRFLLNCLATETKIKTYCKEHKSDKGLINLDSVLHILFKDPVEYPVEYQIHKIKQESNRTEDTESIYPKADIVIVSQEELNIKDEETSSNENSYKNQSKMFLNKYDASFASKIYESNMISLETRGNSINGYSYQQIMVQRNIMEVENVVDVLEEKTNVANNGNTEQKKYIEHNLITANDSPDLESSNNAEAVSEPKLERHRDATEIRMFQCSLCTYEAKTKKALKRHMLVHKDVSEVKMIKCSLCDFVTKHRSCVSKHMILHKDVSEIKMFKCSFCSYEAKQKRYIDNHMLIHKNVSEIKMYKCALCAYEAKTKGNLERHMLVHKDVSEMKMYKCPFCAYEAKRKNNLKTHMFVHKDVSEIKMFKCALCPYEAKKKDYLDSHMLVHMDVSEIKMYKCTFCAYEAKKKNYLVKHMLIHKDASEIKMFKCSFCSYEAKQKSYVKSHMLSHENGSKTKYKCLVCTFQTKHEGDLNKHTLIHINKGRVTKIFP